MMTGGGWGRLAALALAMAMPGAGVRAQVQENGASPSPLEGRRGALPPTITAVPIWTAEPEIDGNLGDPVWQRAEVATDFVQYEPEEGADPSQPTEARVLYGLGALFVAFRAYDSAPDSIAAQLTRRDQESYSDRVLVVVDSYLDRRTAFEFAVNPAGVKRDVYRFEDTREDDSWDAVWEVATRIDEEGWTAEFRIPFSQLRFKDADVQTWGINFAREIARHDEVSVWAPLSRKESGIVSRFGLLEGLEGVQTPNRLEVEPYSMARVEREPGDPTDPFHEETALFGTVGADAKYAVTNNLTLNVTLNPDFGQVEADPGQVNLSAFETFFPEKRPFFLEGQNIFDFGIGLGDGDGASESLFYSRRVGRTPQGEVDVGDGFSDSPENTTILGAWKLSGKTGSGWSVGALHAVTGEERAEILTEDGERTSRALEPRTNYAIARVQKDFRDGWSALGVIATGTKRDASVADAQELRSSAYTGGVDFRHRFGDGGNWSVRGDLLGSRVAGSPEAIAATQRSSARYFQRPDADHVAFDSTRTALAGWASTLTVGKRGGGYWRGSAFFQARSPGFEVNDVGFMRSADYWVVGNWLGYHKSDPGDLFRRWGLNWNFWRESSFGGEETGTGANVNGSFTLNNLWGGWAGVMRSFASLSTTRLRGGPAVVEDAGWSGWSGLYSDSRSSVQVSVNTNWGVTPASDSWRYHVGGELRWRPSGRLNVSLGPFLRRNEDDAQWVEAIENPGGDHYVFARLDQTTVGLTGRMDFSFTPTLSLQLYAQPFVSAGAYSEFKSVADPGAARYGDRYAALAARPTEDGYAVDVDGDGTEETFEDPAFNEKQFRSNAVLRWEYQPGSTLFLVWSQARDHSGTTGGFHLDRDLGDLFGTPSENVLMLKVSYWLTP